MARRPIRHTDTGLGWVNRKFGDIERQIREMRAERRFRSTEIEPGQITIEVLPMAVGRVNLSADNFALDTTGAYLIDDETTVPLGFTAAVVSLTARVYAVNPTAVDDWTYVQIGAGGSSGNALPVLAGPTGEPNDTCVNVATIATSLSGLVEGAAVPLQVWAATAVGAWTASVDNLVDLTGSVTWFNE